jgi:hypothetical protein
MDSYVRVVHNPTLHVLRRNSGRRCDDMDNPIVKTLKEILKELKALRKDLK